MNCEAFKNRVGNLALNAIGSPILVCGDAVHLKWGRFELRLHDLRSASLDVHSDRVSGASMRGGREIFNSG